MKEIIKVTGMSCGHCVKSVEKALAQLPLESAKVEINSVYVEYDERNISHEKIVETIQDAGYEVLQNKLNAV